ncbi:hypothetical protein PHISP_08269, partial [Aspergillus sp. HF37]
MVPMDVNASGQVIWHVEVVTGDQQLRTSELQAIQGPWLKRRTVKELCTSEKALLGWCASAQVRLGTESLEANLKWSTAEVKPTTWRWKGANLQLLAQSAAPIQIGAQAGFAWEHSINTVRFTPGGNYQQCLSNSAMQQVILYDVTARRAWLVSLLSIYHHMLLVYHNMMNPLGNRHLIVAAPSSDGRLSSFNTLRGAGGVVVEGIGEDTLTVRELLMGFSINFSMTSLHPPKGSHIYGYEIMDLVLGSPQSELKTATLKRHGLGWAPLLNE